MMENKSNLPEKINKKSSAEENLPLQNKEAGEDERQKIIEELKKEFEQQPDHVKKKIFLAMELRNAKEKFPFPEITEEAYTNMKKDEEEFPGWTTPIDEIIKRCREEGVKIAVNPGRNVIYGNIFILPYGSEDIEKDSIFPRHLKMDSVADERLKEIIALDSIKNKAIE